LKKMSGNRARRKALAWQKGGVTQREKEPEVGRHLFKGGTGKRPGSSPPRICETFGLILKKRRPGRVQGPRMSTWPKPVWQNPLQGHLHRGPPMTVF